MIVAPEVFLLTLALISLPALAIRSTARGRAPELALQQGFARPYKPASLQRLAPKLAFTLRTMKRGETLAQVQRPLFDAAAALQPVALQAPEAPAKGLHINRLSGIVASAVDQARSAEQFHRSAREQVDAAHYALQNLLDELSAVMPVAKADLPRRTGAVRLVRQPMTAGFEAALAA